LDARAGELEGGKGSWIGLSIGDEYEMMQQRERERYLERLSIRISIFVYCNPSS